MNNLPIAPERPSPPAQDTHAPPASWEDWVERFVPLTNPDGNDSWQGFLFETHGTEFFRVREAQRAQPGTVWTLLDCDGRFVIADGLHMVNRVGYFITERAYTGPLCEFTDDDDDDLEQPYDDEMQAPDDIPRDEHAYASRQPDVDEAQALAEFEFGQGLCGDDADADPDAVERG